ncbi:hypothetical protein PORY_000628 [Pneumocystis oryctolagi]|uniref:Uncharacterized protein n=1 Tax=Pneumocystis oryctolagi TaxID=42067 RepID=A0ACB7CFF9_9ASCO|nr:hypothetical protein PORY_000628 [Pneumocystis oryctolagi]
MKKKRFESTELFIKQRLQIMAMLLHTNFISISLFFFFLLSSIPILWPFWMLYDDSPENGYIRTQWLRRSRIWKWYCQYFPIKLHKTIDLPPDRTYIFGYHPHGVFSLGCFGAFATEGAGFSTIFPGIKNFVLTLSSNFHIPFYREYIQAFGIRSVSKHSCEKILSKGPGHAITIVLGGAQESLAARPGVIKLTLKKRHGFIKMALKMGANLVPVLAFGENDIYNQIQSKPGSRLYKFQQIFKRITKFTIPIFYGRGALNYDIGFIPWRHPINCVVGNPIPVIKTDILSEELINEIQNKYISELKHIWETWKDTYALDRICELEIVD